MARLLLLLAGVLCMTVVLPVRLSKRVAARRLERDRDTEGVIPLFRSKSSDRTSRDA